MKKLILILFAFSLTMGATGQDFWETVDNQFYTHSFDMDQNETIYIGANDTLNNTKGIFKSEDDGQSWEQMYENDAFDPGVVHCKNDMVYFSDGGKLKRSTNQGQSWNTIYPGTENIDCVLHGITGNIYLGSDALCRSADDGQTWDTLLYPAPYIEYFKDILQISEDTLLAASINWVGDGGIYRSTNGGESWDWVLQDCKVTTLASTSDNIIFSGTYMCYDFGGNINRSNDQGQNWEVMLDSLMVESIAITPDNVIYFGRNTEGINNKGVYRSFDYGETWEPIESEIITQSTHVPKVKFCPDGHIYAIASLPGAMNNHYTLCRSYDVLYTSRPNEETDGLTLTARPNPATEHITFERAKTEKAALLRLYDTKGMIVREVRLTKGQKTIEWPVTSWPTGIYFARLVKHGKAMGEAKFVVR